LLPKRSDGLSQFQQLLFRVAHQFHEDVPVPSALAAKASHDFFRVCPTFYTWCFSLGCAAHDANHDARTPCCNAHPRLLRELPTSRGLEGKCILAGM